MCPPSRPVSLAAAAVALVGRSGSAAAFLRARGAGGVDLRGGERGGVAGDETLQMYMVIWLEGHAIHFHVMIQCKVYIYVNLIDFQAETCIC